MSTRVPRLAAGLRQTLAVTGRSSAVRQQHHISKLPVHALAGCARISVVHMHPDPTFPPRPRFRPACQRLWRLGPSGSATSAPWQHSRGP